jgi:hypothetical protein
MFTRRFRRGGRKSPKGRLQSSVTGLPAWKHGQPGQVGNEAALTVVTSAGVRLVTFFWKSRLASHTQGDQRLANRQLYFWCVARAISLSAEATPQTAAGVRRRAGSTNWQWRIEVPLDLQSSTRHRGHIAARSPPPIRAAPTPGRAASGRVAARTPERGSRLREPRFLQSAREHSVNPNMVPSRRIRCPAHGFEYPAAATIRLDFASVTFPELSAFEKLRLAGPGWSRIMKNKTSRFDDS